jgi:protein DGCR14
LHATNAYLSALKNNDPELLSSSIRRLAAIARAKEGGDDARVRELENISTPYMNVPGRNRTPIGARGWDTPVDTRRRDSEAGPSRPTKKVKRIRDDLSLDSFQANYTSEDNASFVQIVDTENRQRKEERWGWAWDAEKKAEQRRIAGEEKRKMILEAATSGRWMIDADGRRLIGGLAEGGKDRVEGEAWKEVKTITPANKSQAVVLAPTMALVKAGTLPTMTETAVPEGHPLQRALAEAGLPSTALISVDDGAIVPHREFTAGEGDGRGRGDADRTRQDQLERSVMGEEESNAISLGGSGVDQWSFKVSRSQNLLTLDDEQLHVSRRCQHKAVSGITARDETSDQSQTHQPRQYASA